MFSVWARSQATVGSAHRAVLGPIVTEQQLSWMSSGSPRQLGSRNPPGAGPASSGKLLVLTPPCSVPEHRVEDRQELTHAGGVRQLLR